MNINGTTKTIGLLGYPVAHTLSPVIHNTLSEQLGQNMCYLPFAVAPEELQHAVKGAYALGIAGLNVTVPHKNAVIACMKEMDPAAQTIGAVNTLVRVEGGFKGYNTDMLGLSRAIDREGIALKGKTVVILGAGGASKAVAYMCMEKEAAKVYILNRTVKKAEEIADHMNQVFRRNSMFPMAMDAYREIAEEALVVFQCTSIGLAPHFDEVVIEDPVFYSKIEAAVDLIYNPAETKFMKYVKQYGKENAVIMNGLSMLLYQGIIAYELWTHCAVSEVLSEYVYDRLYHAVHEDNVVLIGFMGTGKTSVGTLLADQWDYALIDTDAYIETKEKMTISEIFATKGEAYFRQLETDVLTEIRDTCHGVILSTGGGMPLRKENADILKEIGTVVYLCADAQTIYDRIKGDTGRPLLQCEDPYQKIQKLMDERNDKYIAAADVTIYEGSDSIEEIAAKTAKIVRKK